MRATTLSRMTRAVSHLLVCVLAIVAFTARASDSTPTKPYHGWIIGPHRVEVVGGNRIISAYALLDGDHHDIKSERDLILSCNVEHPRCHTPAIWETYAMTSAEGPYKCDNYGLIRVVDAKSDPIRVDVNEQMSVCLDSVK